MTEGCIEPAITRVDEVYFIAHNGKDCIADLIGHRGRDGTVRCLTATTAEWDDEEKRTRLFATLVEEGDFAILCSPEGVQIYATHQGMVHEMPHLRCNATKTAFLLDWNGGVWWYGSFADFFWHFRLLLTKIVVCAASFPSADKEKLYRMTFEIWEAHTEVQRRLAREHMSQHGRACEIVFCVRVWSVQIS